MSWYFDSSYCHHFSILSRLKSKSSNIFFINLLESFRFYYNSGRIKDGRKVVDQFRNKTKADLDDEFLDEFEEKLIKANAKAR